MSASSLLEVHDGVLGVLLSSIPLSLSSSSSSSSSS
eukprot:CAMPEP_0197518644 /NCGR_PEP_ID=MMETSP1318-20131121/3875_1 /TAXON_ID=552666 /ORGANISM="Partenskyella glossopodia, Strain RCC365" /LENGTH=35 /DNA_ID= /DNA_START= /DNA_END= /DNA_ORIENTATION=